MSKISIKFSPEKTGKRIYSCRKELSKSQDAFLRKYGDRLNISRSTLSKWENGDGELSIWNLLELCEIFECDPGYLLCEYDCKRRVASDIQEITGLSCLASDNLEIAASGPGNGPIDEALAEARSDCLRSYEIGRIAKIRFLQALLENDDLWEQISVCAYDYLDQMNRYKIDSFHTVDNITHDMFAKVAKEGAKETLSRLFDKFEPVLFEWE